MRVLVVDQECAGLDFCLRAIADGHSVRWFRQSKRPLGKGFAGLTIVDDWRPNMDWAKSGFVLMTGNAKYTREMDRYRAFGWLIFGPTEASAKLEIDREAGMKAMEAVGIDLPHYETFNSLQEAEAFARKSDQPYVFKTLGSEDDKSLSYVSSDPADMVAWIQRQCARGLKLSGPCILQEKIDMVAEFGVSGWVGPDGFLNAKWQECFEHKKLLSGEVGPNTGEEGTVTQYVEMSELAEYCLVPFNPILETLGHRGDFAIGVGIDAKGKAWPFEFTARCGWPAFYIQTASHKGDSCQWMFDLLKGEDSLKVDRRPAIGVVASQPPYPRFDGKPDCVEGNPIAGLEEVWDDAHPVMMMRGKGPVMDGGKVVERPCLQTAGELVLVMTALGSTVSEARELVYERLKGVGWSDMQYRDDVGEKVEAVLPTLHDLGFAQGIEA